MAYLVSMGIDHEALNDGIRFNFKGYNDKLPELVVETFQKIKDLKKY
jgi:secreted Zn-dependent insulinase-like peptidase